jgi:hypothetical protein
MTDKIKGDKKSDDELNGVRVSLHTGSSLAHQSRK